jgi:hypothetical protein
MSARLIYLLCNRTLTGDDSSCTYSTLTAICKTVHYKYLLLVKCGVMTHFRFQSALHQPWNVAIQRFADSRNLIPLSSPMARLPRSRLKLQIASLFCLLLPALLLLVYFMFPCKHCLGPENFTASSLGGLRNHQNKCEGHLRYQGEAAGHRRSAAALSKKKKSKLSDRKARLVCLWCFCLVP